MDEVYTASEDIKKGDRVVFDRTDKTVSLAGKANIQVARSGAEIVLPVTKIADIPNADIIEVMQTFEQVLDVKLRPVDEQRRYAKFLIKDYTKEKVLGAIIAIEAMRGKPFSPSITSLKELHFKWGKLVDFYRRNQPQPSKVDNLDNLK